MVQLVSGSVPRLQQAVGIELSTLRHRLAQRHLARLRGPDSRRRTLLLEGDILGDEALPWIGRADIIYAANLHFPEEVNERLGHRLLENIDLSKEVFVLALAPLGGFAPQPLGEGEGASERQSQKRGFAASWEIQVPMSWNPGGWPVSVFHFPAAPT